MKSFNLNVPDDKAKDFVLELAALMQKHGITAENQKELSEFVPVTERIKTFDDAVRELGEAHPHVKAYRACCEVLDSPENNRDLLAYLKLRIIVTALNEGWEPQFTEGECRYAPWFGLYTREEVNKLGDEDLGCVRVRSNDSVNACVSFVYALSSNSGESSFLNANFGGRLCFKFHEIAKYAGETFLDLWADLMLF